SFFRMTAATGLARIYEETKQKAKFIAYLKIATDSSHVVGTNPDLFVVAGECDLARMLADNHDYANCKRVLKKAEESADGLLDYQQAKNIYLTIANIYGLINDGNDRGRVILRFESQKASGIYAGQ